MDELKYVGSNLFRKIQEAFSPNYYTCTNLADFLNNKSDIEPSSFVPPPKHNMNGHAGVVFTKSLVCSAAYGNFAELCDMSAELKVFTGRLDQEVRARDPNLSQLANARLYDVIIVYNPEDDLSFLYSYSNLIAPPPRSSVVRSSCLPETAGSIGSIGSIGALYGL